MDKKYLVVDKNGSNFANAKRERVMKTGPAEENNEIDATRQDTGKDMSARYPHSLVNHRSERV